MAFPATMEAVPLYRDDHGIVRVGGTRVTLDSVVWAFRQGATPEEIAARYPTLLLADVYGVIAYYLHQTEVVDVYLRDRQAAAAAQRDRAEARDDPSGIRERLLARRRGGG